MALSGVVSTSDASLDGDGSAHAAAFLRLPRATFE